MGVTILLLVCIIVTKLLLIGLTHGDTFAPVLLHNYIHFNVILFRYDYSSYKITLIHYFHIIGYSFPPYYPTIMIV